MNIFYFILFLFTHKIHKRHILITEEPIEILRHSHCRLDKCCKHRIVDINKENTLDNQIEPYIENIVREK